MEKQEPIEYELTQFASSVEIERTEPKNLFTSTSGDFDPDLNFVMNSFEGVRDAYQTAYTNYVADPFAKQDKLASFPKEAFILQRAMTVIRRLLQDSDVPYAQNPQVISLIEQAVNSEDISQEPQLIQMIAKAIDVLHTPVEEREDIFI